jgi:hypothetical protein
VLEGVPYLADPDAAHLLAIDVSDIDEVDLRTVDALARVALTCRRMGGQVLLVEAAADLVSLLAFSGLADVIRCLPRSGLEPVRQSEEREETRRVQEERDAADAAAGDLQDL